MHDPASHPLGPRKIASLAILASFLWTAQATAQVADPSQSEIDASPTSAPADGSTTSTVTVTLRTAAGTQMPIGGDNVVLDSTLGTLSAVTDNGDGTYTATITSLDAGSATITGTVNGSAIGDDASVTFTAIALEFNRQPSDANVDAVISPSVRVDAVDGNGNRDTGFTGTISITIENDPVGGSMLNGTTSIAAASGRANFTDLSIDTAGSGFTLRATSPPLSDATSVAFDITTPVPDPATSTITASPTSIEADGSSTSTITVQLRDAGDSPITSGGDTVTLATSAGSLTANPATDNGDGTYTATLTASTTAETATITGTVNGADIDDTATVRFSATRLTFGVHPTDTDAGATISPAVTVRAESDDGTLDTQFTGSVTVAIGTNPGGGALSGTTSVSASGGVATFSNLSIDAAGSGYTLTASATGLTGDTSDPFDVTIAEATTLGFVQQPTDTEAGATISPAVTVEAVNGQGGRDTNFNDSITLSVDSGPGNLDGTTTVSAVNGLATFSNLSIDEAANGYTLRAQAGGGLTDATSAAFDVTPAAASGAESEIDAAPGTIVADGVSTSTITVTLRDAFGNDLTSGGDAVLLNTDRGSLGAVTDNGNGTYTATLTSSTTAGTATISGTVNGAPIQDNATVQFIAGGAGSLDFQQQPTTTASGATISPAVTVRATDDNNNTDTSFNGAITLTIGTNPGGGTLSGTTTVSAVNGIATFSNLSIDAAGTGYTLVAQASGLGGDVSAPFDIVPGPPSTANSLIDAAPTAIPADGSSTATVTVTLIDANGNALTTGGDAVTLSTTLGSLGPVTDNGDGTYAATLTSSTSVGTAIVTGTVNGGTISDDAAVQFVAGGANRLEILQQPRTTAAGASFDPPLRVRVADDNGNTVTSFTGTITVAIGNNPGAGTLIGTTAIDAAAGIATFTNLGISTAGSPYTLVFSSPGLVSATTIAFTITGSGGPASPVTSTITANPSAIPANGASTSTITVQLRDAGGANVTDGGDTVTLSTSAGTLSGVIDNGDGTYTASLTSSASPGTAVVSGTVNGATIQNTATVVFTAGSTDLEVTMSVDNPTPTIGETVVYTITVSNLGGTPATGVELTDDLPARLAFVSAEASQGTFDSATGVWQVGELGPFGSATLSITARVRGSAQ